MYSKFFKRLIDIIVSLIAMPFVLVLILVFGIIIYSEDQGTIFYNAKRLGKNGICFKMYKFRSMKVNSPDVRNEDGSTFNSDNDPRLTKVGKFIRKTSIDELPQIINVLKGDMSFVGPRPDLPEDIERYNEYQKKKMNVRPGITGYSQAYFRNSIMNEDKFNNDAYYSENISFLFDLKIIFKTIKTVLFHQNVYVNKGE